MADNQNDRNRRAPEENSSAESARSFNVAGDLTDSLRDQERLKPETAIMELPEVKDIPGQEHVSAAPLGMLADTTISSDDEEGVGILDEDVENDPDLVMNNDSNVAVEEKKLLEKADTTMPSEDERRLTASATDNKDFEGEELEEKSFGDDVTGVNLDVPGSSADNRNESIGEEDEENNQYSLGGDFEEGGEG